MVKTRREINNVPSEHSWRGYAPFYNNAFELMKRIPDGNKTVYDNLSHGIKFYLTKDNTSNLKLLPKLYDLIYLGYYGLKYLFSNKRREVYYKTKMVPIFKDKLSDDAYDIIVEFIIGPGFGMEKKDVSYGHVYKVFIVAMYNNLLFYCY